MNREPERRMPGLPGEVFQPRASESNGRSVSPAKPTTLPSTPPPPPPPGLGTKFSQNQALSYIGDLAEAEDLLTTLLEQSPSDAAKAARDRVIRVKDGLLRSVTVRP